MQDASPGALVSVTDRRGKALGTGFYSSASQIAIRLLARDGIAPGQLLPLIRQRIVDALAFRRQRFATVTLTASSSAKPTCYRD